LTAIEAVVVNEWFDGFVQMTDHEVPIVERTEVASEPPWICGLGDSEVQPGGRLRLKLDVGVVGPEGPLL
jgi:hypothetical protein